MSIIHYDDQAAELARLGEPASGQGQATAAARAERQARFEAAVIALADMWATACRKEHVDVPEAVLAVLPTVARPPLTLMHGGAR